MKKTAQYISQSDRWERRFQKLVEFKKIHGHCNAPILWSENSKLGRWVDNQRKFYRKGKLSEVRVYRLRKLGSRFSLHDFAWQEMHGHLIKFKQEHGHANVPNPFPENQRLAGWVKTQRAMHRREQLNREKIEKLEKIGFVWRPHDTAWHEMYQSLVRFKDAYGRFDVPRNLARDPRLARWVVTQRVRRKTLKMERIRRLDEIGFGW